VEIRDLNEQQQQFFIKPKESSIELGEQPLNLINRDLLNEENFNMDQVQSADKLRDLSNSPPMVASN